MRSAHADTHSRALEVRGGHLKLSVGCLSGSSVDCVDQPNVCTYRPSLCPRPLTSLSLSVKVLHVNANIKRVFKLTTYSTPRFNSKV